MKRFSWCALVFVFLPFLLNANYPLIVLIGHSRSCSTIFERAMYERKDTVCLHEPFSFHYFIERDGATDQDNQLFQAEYYTDNHQNLVNKINSLRKLSPVFIKELGIGSQKMLRDEQFLSMEPLTFFILIRHPLKTLLSLSKLDSQYLDALKEYSALYNCVQILLEKGLKIMFIQAEDFVRDPEYFLKKSAAKSGLPLIYGTSIFKLPPPKVWRNHQKWGQKAINSSSISSSLENTCSDANHAVVFVKNNPILNQYWEKAYQESLFYYRELLKIAENCNALPN